MGKGALALLRSPRGHGNHTVSQSPCKPGDMSEVNADNHHRNRENEPDVGTITASPENPLRPGGVVVSQGMSLNTRGCYTGVWLDVAVTCACFIRDYIALFC